MKTIITTAAFVVLSATAALANSPQGCGPELQFTAGVTEGGQADHSSSNIGIALVFELGKKQACEQHNVNLRDIQLRDIRKKDAEIAKLASETERNRLRNISQQASADIDTVQAFKDKVTFCTLFDETSPASITDFCGDLIGITPKG